MIAYKFLGAGRIGPFSGFAWPEREWVEAAPHVCRTGIHACTAADLPYWMNTELWEIELESPAREIRKLVAPRGRLRRRIESWNEESRQLFAQAGLERLRRLAERTPAAAAYVSDAERRVAMNDAAMVGFITARAAEVGAGPTAYEAERRAQAEWLADRLALDLV